MTVTKIQFLPDRSAGQESYRILYFDETACASEITEDTVATAFCPKTHGGISSIVIELHDGIPAVVQTIEK